MNQTYEQFLEKKSIVTVPTGIESVPKLNPVLFDFQRDITRWALNRGRAAIFAGTGLGKTAMHRDTKAAKTYSTELYSVNVHTIYTQN